MASPALRRAGALADHKEYHVIFVARSAGISDLLMRKNYGFTPNLDFNPFPTRFNFTAYKHAFSEYAAHQGRREQVSMVSV